jgi:hypothetical protein
VRHAAPIRDPTDQTIPVFDDSSMTYHSRNLSAGLSLSHAVWHTSSRSMKLGIVKETKAEERRVAASPQVVAK